MARRTAGFLIAGVWTGLLFVAIGVPPASSADSKPVVAGTFNVRVDPQPSSMPDNFKIQPGSRTYFFGAGCPVGSACQISRVTADGDTLPQPLKASGNGFSWESTTPLSCINTATGAVSVQHGADYTLTVKLMPSATAVRDGITYVTAMRGTMDAVDKINAAGRATNCTIPPNDSFVERQHAVLTATLVPLAAPPPAPLTPPLGVDPGTASSATGTMPAFELPQTDRQQASAEAVADGRRSSVPGALVTPAEAFRNIGDRLPEGLLLVALLGLLMIFPAQIFNSTYEENHERIDKQLARLRLRRRAAPVIPAQPMPPDVSPAAAGRDVRGPAPREAGRDLPGVRGGRHPARRTAGPEVRRQQGVVRAGHRAVPLDGARRARGCVHRKDVPLRHAQRPRLVPPGDPVRPADCRRLRRRLPADELRARLPVRRARWRGLRRGAGPPVGGTGRGRGHGDHARRWPCWRGLPSPRSPGPPMAPTRRSGCSARTPSWAACSSVASRVCCSG